jgi:UDP-N-acetylmuramyl tripeptide synthase
MGDDEAVRKFLAIITCKLAAFAGRLLKRGSSLPGSLALKICPDILSRLTLPEKIVAVTGSNGKTSTVELLASALERSDMKVVWNREGSTQTDGVATMLLRASSLCGRVKCDAVVMESDEQYARHTFKHLKPAYFTVLNLCRDQLTRNGHPEYIFERIAEAVTPGTELILNADDPLTSSLIHA